MKARVLRQNDNKWMKRTSKLSSMMSEQWTFSSVNVKQ